MISEAIRRRTLSVVAPVYQEAAVIRLFLEELLKVLRSLEGYAWEVILVDDGSRDETLEILKDLRHAEPRIKWIALSRNFGHQAALTAGLDHASGDAVITMDADLQHPVHLIPQMLRQWEAGFDIVATVRQRDERTGLLKRLTSTWFYRILNRLSPIAVRESGADFRLLSGDALHALRRLGETHRFLRGMVAWLGFRVVEIEFLPRARAGGASKYSWRKMILLAMDGMTSFSVAPLRLILLIGLIVFLLTLAYAGYAVVIWFIHPASLQAGWASLLISVNLLGGAILLALGIIGEYIGRIFEQVKSRPIYLIRELEGFEHAGREIRTLP